MTILYCSIVRLRTSFFFICSWPWFRFTGILGIPGGGSTHCFAPSVLVSMQQMPLPKQTLITVLVPIPPLISIVIYFHVCPFSLSYFESCSLLRSSMSGNSGTCHVGSVTNRILWYQIRVKSSIKSPNSDLLCSIWWLAVLRDKWILYWRSCWRHISYSGGVSA